MRYFVPLPPFAENQLIKNLQSTFSKAPLAHVFINDQKYCCIISHQKNSMDAWLIAGIGYSLPSPLPPTPAAFTIFFFFCPTFLPFPYKLPLPHRNFSLVTEIILIQLKFSLNHPSANCKVIERMLYEVGKPDLSQLWFLTCCVLFASQSFLQPSC